MISQFWSDDKKLSADVRLFEERRLGPDTAPASNMYAVDFKRDGVVVETRYFPGKSESYAESAAENWTLGILNL
jgi:hypothetical protein